MLTSEHPEPRHVLSEISTSTTPRVLNQEDVLKFYIGLRLLGEKKQKRVLAYMRSLQEKGSKR